MALLWNKKEVAVVLSTMLNITAVLCVPNESDEGHRYTFTRSRFAFMKPVKGFHYRSVLVEVGGVVGSKKLKI